MSALTAKTRDTKISTLRDNIEYNNNKIKIIKEKQNKRINKDAHSCNIPRIPVFKWCVKEAVVAAAFMFELNLLHLWAKK